MTETTPANGQRRQRLVEAFLSAFDSKNDLAQVVHYALGERLVDITDAKGLREDVFNLFDSTDKHGTTPVLVCKALAMRPRNALLREVAREFGCPEPSEARQPVERREEQAGEPAGGTTPVETSRNETTQIETTPTEFERIHAAWRRAGICALISMFVVFLELLNRRSLHVLQLYLEMEAAGAMWTLLMVLASFWHVLRAPSRDWRMGAIAWLASVALFVAVDLALRRGSFAYFNPAELQWLLPFFYGCSFGALAWGLCAFYGTSAPSGSSKV